MLDDFLLANGLNAKVLNCRTKVHSAKQAAELMRCPLHFVLKSVLFVDSEQNAVLALLPGNRKASALKIAKAAGFSKVRLANPEEVFDFTGYKIGGVPPVSVYGVTTVLDESFEDGQTVWAGGGDDEHLLNISIAEIKAFAHELKIADIGE